MNFDLFRMPLKRIAKRILQYMDTRKILDMLERVRLNTKFKNIGQALVYYKLVTGKLRKI